jgi:hypothetical protein
MQRVADFDV